MKKISLLLIPIFFLALAGAVRSEPELIDQPLPDSFSEEAPALPTLPAPPFIPKPQIDPVTEPVMDTAPVPAMDSESADPFDEIGSGQAGSLEPEARELEPARAASETGLCLHLFNRPDCPQCAEVAKILAGLEDKHGVSVKVYDITVPENEELYRLFKNRYGLKSASHPIIFVGDRYFIGDRAIRENIEAEVERCLKEPCVCPLQSIKATTPFMPRTGEVTPEAGSAMRLPIVGEVDFSQMPLYAMTAVIAFVDGFNPCSLWLITFLLGIIIYSGSKKKIFLVGATFLLVTGGAYALFMVGLLNVFLYVGYMKWIQAVVALLALVFAAVNIKDYFWYKKGISFTISDKHRPKIFKDVRNIMKDGKSTLALISATAVMALGVVLVELPCTAGFPVIWTNLIAQNQVEGLSFGLLLLLYMAIYLFDEIIVIGVVATTLKLSRFEEKHGRILKLVGGMIMLALALVMLFKPSLMDSIASSLLIFLSALAASGLILLIHRYILPKFGISFGTEEGLVDGGQAAPEEPFNKNKDNL